MNKIDKARKLYDMIASRCEAGGFSREQAATYREMIDFMADCTTFEEATEKFKGSKYYYYAAGAALEIDKLCAYERASIVNNMPDVAAVYAEKAAEIRADMQAMYVSGYETKAQRIKAAYMGTYESFGQLYDAWLMLSCTESTDDLTIDTYVSDMKKTAAGLKKPSADISSLAAIPAFRRLVGANDAGYAHFVSEAASPDSVAARVRANKTSVQAEGKMAWDEVKAKKDEIMRAGAGHAEGTKTSRVTAVAPKDRTGKYSFINEEVR